MLPRLVRIRWHVTLSKLQGEQHSIATFKSAIMPMSNHKTKWPTAICIERNDRNNENNRNMGNEDTAAGLTLLPVATLPTCHEDKPNGSFHL